MLPQLAEYAAIIGTLVLMEGLLAADNALVLAVLVSRLPKRSQQRKALLYGIVGAFVFRGLSLVAVTWLIAMWEFKALGALYLFYITIHYFWSGAYKADQAAAHATDPAAPVALGKAPTFWPTVIMVELTDIAFSVDQIVAAVALSNELWLVYTGGMLGIIAMRFAAGGFLVLIEKHPKLAYTGHLLPAWIGLKLAIKTLGHEPFNLPVHMPPWLFWSVMAALVAWGLLSTQKPRPKLPEGDERPTSAADTSIEEGPRVEAEEKRTP